MVSGVHDLNLLVPLRALLEEVSVSRAAQRAHMSQPSMSGSLARLRQVFGDELLVRVGRDYELTPLARELLPRVRQSLPPLEQALGVQVPSDPGTACRTFRFMATDYDAMRLAPATAAVLDEAPGVDVSIGSLPDRPMESERDLLNSDFVVAIAGIGIEGSSVDFIVDDFVCLVDHHNPSVRDGTLSMDDFLTLPQALAQFGNHYTPADRALRELGVNRRDPRVTTASYLTLPSVIAGTDLVAVVPRGVARMLGPGTGTIGIDPPFGRVELAMKLFWHESHDADALHLWFRTRLVEECAVQLSNVNV